MGQTETKGILLMKKKRCFAAVLAALIMISGCEVPDLPAETVSIYEKDIVQGMIDSVGVPDRLTGEAASLCVIENEEVFDESLFAAAHAGLFSESDGEVLYSKKALEKLYPASLTKCMTALLVLEHCQDTSETVTVGPEVGYQLTEGASLANLTEGETLTVKDLLISLLVPSGNDAANVLAVYVAGDVESFVGLMNSRAAELCMLNTHFMNPHGLHDDNHYTTVYDLYLLVRECMKHPEFRDAASRAEITVNGALPDGSFRSHEFKSTNSYLRNFTVPPEGLYVAASKTGYTVSAGHNLILVTEDTENRMYIAVIAGAASYDALYLEMSALLSVIGQ